MISTNIDWSELSFRGQKHNVITSWNSKLGLGPHRRTHALRIAISALLIVFFLFWRFQGSAPQHNGPSYGEDFHPLLLPGFVNEGRPGVISCDSIRHKGNIAVQQSFFVYDDIHKIAGDLKDHPLVDYAGQDVALSYEQIVEKTWLRMAQSSVWLEKFQVYLAVTRIIFYDKGVRHWPIMSFLTGQIYTADWTELVDYTIEWEGEFITFPRTFDIPAPYTPGGGFYGPEDPRILIEHDVPDAEPVIAFNMVSHAKRSTRSMYIFRPFTGATIMLSVVGREPEYAAEKNWMPFFYNQDVARPKGRRPNRYLHFVYKLESLEVLKCHLADGVCDWVYVQKKLPDGFGHAHHDDRGSIRGGTNFVPVRSEGEVQSFVGFPRTHIDSGCVDPSYRPELMILTGTSPSHFHVDYTSEPIDFETAAMTTQALHDPCGEGRILIANSISRWDRTSAMDTMTVSFSVDDATTQILRLQGVAQYLENLPGRPLTRQYNISAVGAPLFDLQWSAPSTDVMSCSVGAATNYTLSHAARVNGTDLRKQREKAEAEAKADAKSRESVNPRIED